MPAHNYSHSYRSIFISPPLEEPMIHPSLTVLREETILSETLIAWFSPNSGLTWWTTFGGPIDPVNPNQEFWISRRSRWALSPSPSPSPFHPPLPILMHANPLPHCLLPLSSFFKELCLKLVHYYKFSNPLIVTFRWWAVLNHSSKINASCDNLRLQFSMSSFYHLNLDIQMCCFQAIWNPGIEHWTGI